MPGPLDAYERIDVGGTIAPEPVPEPGLGDLFTAGRVAARLEAWDAPEQRIANGYAPILDALGLDRWQNPAEFGELGSLSRESSLLPKRGYGSNYATRSQQEALIVEAIQRRRLVDPKFLPGIPGTVEGLHAYFLEQDKKRHGEARATLAQPKGVGGRIAAFTGGVVGAMSDPFNLMTLPVGGFGKTVARRVLSEGLVQGGVEAVQQPGVARTREQLGEEYTPGDFLLNVGLATVGGAAFRGAFEGASAGGKAAAQGLRTTFPDWARSRDAKAFGKQLERAVRLGDFGQDDLPMVAARLLDPRLVTLSDAEAKAQLQRELEAGTIDDRAIAEHFRQTVPEHMRTPEELAALDALERQADTAESSPYKPDPGAEAQHEENLAETLRRLIDSAGPTEAQRAAGQPEPEPVAVPVRISRNEIVRFVINDLEGGAAVVRYNRSDGGTTKWGIAQRDHPEVDVASLTEAQAGEIAIRKYWFRELDQVDSRLAAVAFDAGFISGPKVGKRILRESGGDVAQALRLYRAHLNRIADTVKGKAKYKKGWNRRVDRLAERLQASDAPFERPVPRNEAFTDDGGPDAWEPFGPVHRELADDWEATVARLRQDKTGEVPEALFHPEVGRFSVVWGEPGPEGFGLAHILSEHADVVADLPDRIAGMRVFKRTKNRIQMESDVDRAAVRLDWDGREKMWLLTAFEKKAPAPAEDRRAGAAIGRDVSPSRGAGGDIAQNALEGKVAGPVSTSSPEVPTEPGRLQLRRVGRSYELRGEGLDQARLALTKNRALGTLVQVEPDRIVFPYASLDVHFADLRKAKLPIDLVDLDGGVIRNAKGGDVESVASEQLSRMLAESEAPAPAPEALARFDEPSTGGADLQVASLEHDLRMDVQADPELSGAYRLSEQGEAQELRTILEQLDREAAGADALAACMKPKGGAG